jgi:hypothetical protein
MGGQQVRLPRQPFGQKDAVKRGVALPSHQRRARGIGPAEHSALDKIAPEPVDRTPIARDAALPQFGNPHPAAPGCPGEKAIGRRVNERLIIG